MRTKRVVAILLLFGVTLSVLTPFLFDLNGYSRILFMVSNSMSPTIKKGDLMLVAPVYDCYTQVNVEDIIVFKTEFGRVVHRVYDVRRDVNGTIMNPNEVLRITTKGDNETVIQPFEADIRAEQVLGRVYGVIRYPNSVIMVFIPILIVFIMVVYEIYSRRKKNEA